MSYSQNITRNTETEAKQWATWLHRYGAEAFYHSFMASSQDAKGRCIYCQNDIFLDMAEGGGVPDWKTDDGDYGCDNSPDTTEDGCGGHTAEKGTVSP